MRKEKKERRNKKTHPNFYIQTHRCYPLVKLKLAIGERWRKKKKERKAQEERTHNHIQLPFFLITFIFSRPKGNEKLTLPKFTPISFGITRLNKELFEQWWKLEKEKKGQESALEGKRNLYTVFPHNKPLNNPQPTISFICTRAITTLWKWKDGKKEIEERSPCCTNIQSTTLWNSQGNPPN